MKQFKIYQLPIENRAKFMNLGFVKSHKIMPSINDYNFIYEGEVEDNATLDDIFTMFNVNHPSDYKGHSLSVSDVVLLDGEYFYCDSYSWERIDFSQEDEFESLRHKISALISSVYGDEANPLVCENPIIIGEDEAHGLSTLEMPRVTSLFHDTEGIVWVNIEGCPEPTEFDDLSLSDAKAILDGLTNC